MDVNEMKEKLKEMRNEIKEKKGKKKEIEEALRKMRAEKKEMVKQISVEWHKKKLAKLEPDGGE